VRHSRAMRERSRLRDHGEDSGQLVVVRVGQRGERRAARARILSQDASELASAGRMTRDGCIVELLVNVDENGVVFDLARVNRDRAAGKHTNGLSGGQVVA
jgi:hypothetical protein